MRPQETIARSVLPYERRVPVRRGRRIVLITVGAIAQFVLLFVLSFYRKDVRLDWIAWILEFPLLRLASALDVPLAGASGYLLALLNALCWVFVAIACARFFRRLRRSVSQYSR
jgi:hypothetical protein